MASEHDDRILAEIRRLRAEVAAASPVRMRHGWLRHVIKDLETDPHTQYRVHFWGAVYWLVNFPAVAALFFFAPALWVKLGIFITLIYSIYANFATDYGAMSAAMAAFGQPLPAIPLEAVAPDAPNPAAGTVIIAGDPPGSIPGGGGGGSSSSGHPHPPSGPQRKRTHHMSDWKITITAGAGGDIPDTAGLTAVSLVMSHTSGEIPHGTFTIEGSDDGNRVRLQVVQHDAAGRFVTSAAHVRDRAEAVLHEAEAELGTPE